MQAQGERFPSEFSNPLLQKFHQSFPSALSGSLQSDSQEEEEDWPVGVGNLGADKDDEGNEAMKFLSYFFENVSS